jgi:hypothetical protein
LPFFPGFSLLPSGPPCEGNKEKPGKKGKTHRSAKEDATLALLVVVERIHDYQQREGRVLFGGTVSFALFPGLFFVALAGPIRSRVSIERERERERGEEREKKVSTTRSFPQLVVLTFFSLSSPLSLSLSLSMDTRLRIGPEVEKQREKGD